jgi:hypothetical protein
MTHLLINHVTNPKCINQPQGTWSNSFSGFANATLLDSGKYRYTLPANASKGGFALGTFNDLNAERIVVFRVLESIDKTVNNGLWIEQASVVEQFDEHTIALKISSGNYTWHPFLFVPAGGYTLDWVCSFTPDDYQTLRAYGLTHFDGDTMPKIQ